MSGLFKPPSIPTPPAPPPPPDPAVLEAQRAAEQKRQTAEASATARKEAREIGRTRSGRRATTLTGTGVNTSSFPFQSN